MWDRDRRIERRVATALKVLYEDDDAIAVFKPSGLLTHPTEAKEKDTLLARVSTYVQKRHGGGARTYVSIVHRLDKETSGILVFARSRRGLIGMQAQLRAHTMDRRYRAVVEGDLAGDAGTFDKDLVAEPGERRRGVTKPGEQGLKAVTEWTVLERFGIATLVEARLKTGRTHQIRIHFANAGHVLVGDSVYRDRKAKPFPVPFPQAGAPRRAPRLEDGGGQDGLAGRGPSRRLPQAAGRVEEEGKKEKVRGKKRGFS